METSHTPQGLLAKKDAAPLAVFRIFFGFMVLVSLVRFTSYGWIDKLYIEPSFFFTYYGFEWVRPLGQWTYVLYAVTAIAATGVMVGYRYRLSACLLFVSWTYIELMDKTHYLNHYYAVSLIAFMLVWLPAASYYSLDAARSATRRYQYVPVWAIWAPRLMVGIIYFYAGIAKINTDWLLAAQPLKTWLPSKYGIPLIGPWLEQAWVAYAFSWTGMLFDIAIPFLLLIKRWRPAAFAAVVIFHVLTRVLFPIGIFPFVMIVCATIFFDSEWHHKILDRIAHIIGHPRSLYDNGLAYIKGSSTAIYHRIQVCALVCFFTINLLFPFRYLLYPSPTDLFWTEYGFRYSWRVMLMEKAGYASFTVVDSSTGSRYAVDNDAYLTAIQQKQMATQTDMMIQYAHYLEQVYKASYGITDPQVYVESYVALNGRRSQPYLRPDIDLTTITDGLYYQDLLLPYQK